MSVIGIYLMPKGKLEWDTEINNLRGIAETIEDAIDWFYEVFHVASLLKTGEFRNFTLYELRTPNGNSGTFGLVELSVHRKAAKP